jgi:FkbM family methyltransferase
MLHKKANTEGSVVRFESYGEEIQFFLPDRHDHIQKIIASEKRFYEQKMLDDIRSRVSPGSLAIDVGASIGNHTIFFSKVCKLRVIALEPVLDAYKILMRNVELNGQNERVTVLRKAAGSSHGRGEPVSVDPLNLGMSWIHERPVGQIEIIPIDHLEFEGPVSLLKIDVEGMELDVVRGAAKIIDQFQPLIYVEAKDQRSRQELNSLLGRLGYCSVLEFNWTPTFLFMPCKESYQRMNILIECFDRFQNAVGSKFEEILTGIGRIEERSKDTEKRVIEQGETIVSKIAGIEEETGKIDEYLRELENSLGNRMDALDLNLKHISEQTGWLQNELERGFIETKKRVTDAHEHSLKLEKTIENYLPKFDRLNEQFRNLENKLTRGIEAHGLHTEDQIKEVRKAIVELESRYKTELQPKKLHDDETPEDIGLLKKDFRNAELCESDTAKQEAKDIFPSVATPSAEKVIVSMASIPQRESMLRDAVSSLYPAVDSLRVFLNNYDDIPEFLLQDKIEVCRSQDYGDNGDAGKFFWVDNDTEGYLFYCDDDLVYPPDYVDYIIKRLKQYDNSAIIGLHGILLKQPLVDYYNRYYRYVKRFLFECKRDHSVHILGTGCVAYHTSVISLYRKDFIFRNMADIWLALEAQKQKVPMICIEHPKNWLIENKVSDDTLNIYTHSSYRKESALDSSIVQNQVVRKNHPFTIQVPPTPYPKKKKLVLGITTYNRRDYLQACLESFLETRNADHGWVVIVADDGSTDDTLEYLENLDFSHELHIIKNTRRYACGQTNTIFELSQKISFDVGFKVDDDLVFKKKGWDDLYIKTMEKSGWQHLVYRNHKVYNELRQRDEPNFQHISATTDASGYCEAFADVNMCYGTGPFYIFTPDIIEKVGYCDEPNFPIRGQWHVDYHIRCCRAGFNDTDHLYDAIGSNEYLDVQNNIIDDYRCAIPWGEEYAKTKEPAELARRQKVIDDESRVYISLLEKIVPPRPTDINSFFDKIYVPNLDRRPDRWEKMKSQADKYGIDIHRFPAVDGMQEPHKSEWESYFQRNLVTHPEGISKVNSSFEYNLDYDSDIARVAYLEKRNQKKAIQSPGAWGYLKTMIMILEEAMEEDLDSILVFDDDAVFHKNINVLFDKFIRQIPDEWKILQLGTLQYHWGREWISWFSENTYLCNGSSICSHAVGMHHSIFPLLLNYSYKFDLPYDEGALHKAKHDFNESSFTFYPNLIIQDTSESDINSSDVQENEGRKKENIYRWNLSDYNFIETDNAANYEKPHILYLINNFPTLSEAFIINEISGLIDEGLPISIVSLKDTRWQKKQHKKVEDYKLVERTIYLEDYRDKLNENGRIAEGKELLSENRDLSPDQKEKLSKYFQSKEHRKRYLIDFLKVYEIAKEKKPDIIYCHFGNVAEIFVELKDLLGLPLITYFHGYDFSRLPKEGVSYTELFKAGDRFFTNSRYTKDRIKELGCPEHKIKVIGLPIDHEEFRYKKRMPGKTVEILTIARLTEKKGLKYSIAAVARVIKKYVDVNYSIIGDGEQKSELEALIKDLGCTDKIRLLGPQTQEEVVKHLQNAHTFVLSSVTAESGDAEGLGVVLLEAQLCGVPVIATRHNGFMDSVSDGKSGFLVPEKDVDALVEKMSFLIENPNLWPDLGKKGRKHVINHYSYEVVLTKIQKEFDLILGTT